ncbi:MAG TPA: YbaB/EbfC family nucleoid-associated protein [Desulfovibrio sp.]|jgi:DNA-binding YbaB/EbfC family protein|uniref:YbaB/EbfC family nucleoid-associated protein n=1 Tax=Desulfovibrio TaxID=872 RepID=UPI0003FB0B84|nr:MULTISPECIES: YbaB/EbfC family nucleoid-associated protein [Desulfovibrio]MDY0306587.1 YbaB/EbfC family nucleoid-associated protein [Desulfovibrionaceae bacterium]HMM37136.1 YbaB/EbfC family nucleoid-associated protein [Desulfovibrio sp.]
MKGMNEMLRQAQIMQKKLLAAQEGLKSKVVEAASGGGMVMVQANGSQEIISVTIDPSVVASGDVEMLQDLVLAAVNEALKKAKEIMEQEMGQVTGGMRIPGLL